jgi:hypothetical protein
MGDLLAATLRSPRELAAIIGLILVAVVVTAPLPALWQAPAAIGLAAIPGTMLVNRVRKRLLHERDQRQS